MAEYFYQQGYAVYAVRLRGHGTAPEDLAERTWEDWYHSFNRGYAVIKSVTDHIIVGGFSTGGCLALLAAARKGIKVQAAFTVCAPLQVNNYWCAWCRRLWPERHSKRLGQARSGTSSTSWRIGTSIMIATG